MRFHETRLNNYSAKTALNRSTCKYKSHFVENAVMKTQLMTIFSRCFTLQVA